MKKRPLIYVLAVFATTVFCLAQQFNDFTEHFGFFSKIFSLEFPNTLAEIKTWVADFSTSNSMINLFTIVFFVLAVLSVVYLFSWLLSGFAYMLYVSLYDKINRQTKTIKTNRLWKDGVNKRIWKCYVYCLFVLLFAMITILLALVTMNKITTWLGAIIAGNSGGMIFSIIGIALLLFFTIIFSVLEVIFFSMELPSLVVFKKGSLKAALKISFKYCWYLFPRIFGFMVYFGIVDIIMLAFNFGNGSLVKSIIVLICNIILKTIGVLLFSKFTFGTFIEMKDEVYPQVKKKK